MLDIWPAAAAGCGQARIGRPDSPSARDGRHFPATLVKVAATSVRGGDPSTVNGWVHGLAFVAMMLSALLATMTLAAALRRDPRWRPLAMVCILTAPALIAVLFLGPESEAKFFVFMAILFGWIFALAHRLYRLS